MYVFSDSCPLGGAAVFKGDWFYRNWEVDYPSMGKTHINDLELLSIIEAAHRWAPLWYQGHVLFHTDSLVTKCILSRSCARSPFAQSCLRELATLAMLYGFHYSAVHVPGHLNVLPDALSRLHEPSKANWFLKTCSNNFDIDCTRHMSFPAFCQLGPPGSLGFVNETWRLDNC